jgi:hypothetical protein
MASRKRHLSEVHRDGCGRCSPDKLVAVKRRCIGDGPEPGNVGRRLAPSLRSSFLIAGRVQVPRI